MNESSWMEHPSLKGIDPERLQLLSNLAVQAQGKNQNELMSFLMAAASGQGKNLSFSPSEIDAILEVLKSGRSPEQIKRIEKAYAMIKKMNATSRRSKHSYSYTSNPPKKSPSEQATAIRRSVPER